MGSGTKSSAGLVYWTAGRAPRTKFLGVVAHRSAGEGLVAEHGAVLEVHHRLQRHERGEVGRLLLRISPPRPGHVHGPSVERYEAGCSRGVILDRLFHPRSRRT